MWLSSEEVEGGRIKDRKRMRRLYLVFILVTAAVFLASLCCRVYQPGFIAPKQAFLYLSTSLRFSLSEWLGTSYSLDKKEILAGMDMMLYSGSVIRLKRTLLYCFAGMALALSGSIFQTIYKNPMASPNIIGATVGVNLGNVLVVIMLGGSGLAVSIATRYRFCYGFTAAIMCFVLVLGKLAGGRKSDFGVIEMVMAGSVVSQAFSVVSTYLMYCLEDEDLVTYQMMSLGTSVYTDALSMLLFAIMMAGSILPILLIRFRFNGAAMGRDEARLCGINSVPLRLWGQVCGVVMVTAALIHVGDVGMLTLALPHLARYFVGADFRRVSIFSMLMGAIVLMGCHIVSSQFYINSTEIPVNFFISLCIMPVFMRVLMKQRRGFE